MLKIDIGRFIEESDVECICEYVSKPVKALAHEQDKKGMADFLRGKRRGFRSLIITEEGYVYVCHLLPQTYFKRCKAQEGFHEISKNYYIRKSSVRQVISGLTRKNRRELEEAKTKGLYVNLARNKNVTHYIFTKNGRIYGVHCNVNIFESEEDKT